MKERIFNIEKVEDFCNRMAMFEITPDDVYNKRVPNKIRMTFKDIKKARTAYNAADSIGKGIEFASAFFPCKWDSVKDDYINTELFAFGCGEEKLYWKVNTVSNGARVFKLKTTNYYPRIKGICSEYIKHINYDLNELYGYFYDTQKEIITDCARGETGDKILFTREGNTFKKNMKYMKAFSNLDIPVSKTITM